MIIDLHSHTNLSDGSLPPDELLLQAGLAGVELFAITDHDTFNAYAQIKIVPKGLTLIPGIEFSTTWGNAGIHIVGLNVDLARGAVRDGAAQQTTARELRAQQISEKLEKLGIKDALAGAAKFSEGSYIGRPQFAQHLVACGAVANMQQAFKRYLGAGKVGDVKQHWASMEQVIGWINQSGGTAVLAHPLKYKFTLTKLKRLLTDFIDLGGQAMEVVSGQQQLEQTRTLSRVCQQMNLLASTGSDFHMPGQPWAALGRQPKLPENCLPVWKDW